MCKVSFKVRRALSMNMHGRKLIKIHDSVTIKK